MQIHISGFSRIHSYPSTPRKKSIVCFKKTFFQHFCVWAAFSDLIYVCVCMCSKKKVLLAFNATKKNRQRQQLNETLVRSLSYPQDANTTQTHGFFVCVRVFCFGLHPRKVQIVKYVFVCCVYLFFILVVCYCMFLFDTHCCDGSCKDGSFGYCIKLWYSILARIKSVRALSD